eukprot:TRINITY_DN1163_c0_g2_i4.p1 TRINITY_DN1163_c0_g2~~TRINITY_DN1163_c0_g2_i4.p1  ORF type:complete len:316 (+),score=63.05 TRINITY_DN1163_c0_g2_i4:81-1028(+)
MKQVAIFLVLVAIVSAIGYEEGFASWMKTYNKVYSSDEFQYRFTVWKNNMDFITNHNSDVNKTFFVAMNKFGDLTSKEFGRIYNGYLPRDIPEPTNVKSFNTIGLPTTVDWRNEGAVTPIKNQGQCGSCWTFSSTGGIEGQWKIHKGHLVSLSEQNILDCDRQGYGCSGGWMDWAFNYVQSNGGIDSEASYPYTAVQGSCKYNAANKAASIIGHQDITSGSESALQVAVANVGPISVAIDASHSSFQFYRGGIYYEPLCSTTSLDHAVLAVGYGPGYWLVKNSWGTDWGLSGYIQMSRDRNNNCGIATKASHPIV